MFARRSTFFSPSADPPVSPASQPWPAAARPYRPRWQIWGYGNLAAFGVAQSGVVAAIGLPRPQIPQHAEKDSLLAPRPSCHKPQNANAAGPGIATTPNHATHAAHARKKGPDPQVRPLEGALSA